MSQRAVALDPFLTSGPEHQRGAYAIIRDDQRRVLLVQAASGRFYLPGGRMEGNESPAQALAREIIEECGWHADIFGPAWRGEQPILDGAVLLAASYWKATLSHPSGTAAEHLLVWLTQDDALKCLHRECDRLALAALG